MEKIEKLMEMLDWNNPIDIQEKGCALCAEFKNLEVFLQPVEDAYNKNVWDNCAEILSRKSDEELAPYLCALFEWLQDMNWPGACCILERLRRYGIKTVYDIAYAECVEKAMTTNDEIWLENLYEINK